MEGIREAHEEYPNPETKKNIVVAILNFLGDWIPAGFNVMLIG